MTPVNDWNSTPTRFVAFAISAGMPNIISAGRVSIDPPPARTLMKPANNPATNNALPLTSVNSKSKV